MIKPYSSCHDCGGRQHYYPFKGDPNGMSMTNNLMSEAENLVDRATQNNCPKSNCCIVPLMARNVVKIIRTKPLCICACEKIRMQLNQAYEGDGHGKC